MLTKKQQRHHWLNQKYILAVDKLPEGYITVEQYIKKYWPMLTQSHIRRLGFRAKLEYKGPINLLKDSKYTTVRFYTKEYLDSIFLKFAQES